MKSGPLLAARLVCSLNSRATDFDIRGGPKPANIDELANLLEQHSSTLPPASSQALTPR
jgi:hypothetical protein